jgi:hypothetical protein
MWRFAVTVPQPACGIIGPWMFCAAGAWLSRMNLSSSATARGTTAATNCDVIPLTVALSVPVST